jgi:hypothetical protein
MTQPTEPGQPARPPEGADQFTPAVLDLQRLLADRLRGGNRPSQVLGSEEYAVVSITSCNSHSCM